MKKSKESVPLKNSEKLEELTDPRVAIKKAQPKKSKNKSTKAHKPTPENRKLVYSLAAYGATHEDIAISIAICKNTLYKFYEEELQNGMAISKNTIAQKIYQIAVGRAAEVDRFTNEVITPEVKPNLQALIFLCKVRLGWKETQVVEQNVEMKSAGVQIYLPDNGMQVSDSIDVT